MSSGYFGVAIYHPRHEINVGGLWRSALAFGAAFVATVGRRYTTQASDTAKTDRAIPLHHFADIDDLVTHLPHSCPLVGVEQDPRAASLTVYQHRPRALYLLGAEDHGLPQAVVDRCHDLVQIPSAVPWPLNVASAGTVVLAHRHMAVARQAVPA